MTRRKTLNLRDAVLSAMFEEMEADERIIRYANLVGHSSICWAKLEALSEGARRASAHLWR